MTVGVHTLGGTPPPEAAWTCRIMSVSHICPSDRADGPVPPDAQLRLQNAHNPAAHRDGQPFITAVASNRLLQGHRLCHQLDRAGAPPTRSPVQRSGAWPRPVTHDRQRSDCVQARPRSSCNIKGMFRWSQVSVNSHVRGLIRLIPKSRRCRVEVGDQVTIDQIF
jgi:hypothetical protein